MYSLTDGVSNIIVGKVAEEYATRYLEEKGYQIIERNYRCRLGELDIVARTGYLWAFVEVKGRRSDRYGTPAEAITTGKQKRFINAVNHYVMTKDIDDEDMRIDVVEVFIDGDRMRINHILNAF
ncbi:MAG: YraN family protein [Anaerovoracaceae bacterium]|jgi:putative endonuclease